MNDLDEWLNSIGIENTPSEASVTPVQSTNTPQQQEPQSSDSFISPDDFNEILAENGFEEPVYEEAEEVTDGNEEEDEEESTEYNPLDQIETTPALEVSAPEESYQEEEVTQVEVPAASPDENLLPLNSPTLLIDESTSRFSGTEWYNEIQKTRIILAGLGGIGSYCAYNLARMNPTALFLYDDDVVEQVNMSGQLYSQQDIGKPKVDAVSDMLSQYTVMRNIYAIKDRFTEHSEPGDIMICGFDNMAARKTFFDAWHNHMLHYTTTKERAKCLFLDGRLSIDTLQIFCITGDNEYACDEYYSKYLFSDSEADETVCSMKQTTYLACMIGSFIVNLFTNWVANSLNPVIPYDLPFFTEYDAQNMIFKTVS